MNEVKLFDFESNKIRTVMIDNEPYFVGKDVAKVLGYAEPRSAVSKKVDDEDKGVAKIATPSGTQEMTVINESGVYSLVFSSKLPSAKKFKRWVTSEVLPTLRKTGSYQMPTNPMQALELMFQALKETNDGVTQIEKRVTEIEENAPLTPSEYSMLCRKINERIRTIKHERGLEHLNREQQSELYRSINRDIKTVTGVQVRSQIRQKALSRVLEFVYDWEPSKATLYTIQQIPLDL